MATQVTDTPDGYIVSRIVGRGRRRRIPRHPVRIVTRDVKALIATVIVQAEEARKEVGIQQPVQEPVV